MAYINGRYVAPVRNAKGEIVKYVDPQTGRTVQETVNITQSKDPKISTGRTKITYTTEGTIYEHVATSTTPIASKANASKTTGTENVSQAIINNQGKIVGSYAATVTPEGNVFVPTFSTTEGLQQRASLVNDRRLVGGYVEPGELNYTPVPKDRDIKTENRLISDIQKSSEGTTRFLGLGRGGGSPAEEVGKGAGRFAVESGYGILSIAPILSGSAKKLVENPKRFGSSLMTGALVLGSEVRSGASKLASGDPGTIGETAALGASFLIPGPKGLRFGPKALGRENIIKPLRTSEGEIVGQDVMTTFKIEDADFGVGSIVTKEGDIGAVRIAKSAKVGKEAGIKEPTLSEIINIPKGVTDVETYFVPGKEGNVYEKRSIMKVDEGGKVESLESQFNADKMLFDVETKGPGSLLVTEEFRIVSSIGGEGYGITKTKLFENVGKAEASYASSSPYYFERTGVPVAPKDLQKLSVTGNRLIEQFSGGGAGIRNTPVTIEEVAKAASKELLTEYIFFKEPTFDVSFVPRGFGEGADMFVRGRRPTVTGKGFGVAASKETVEILKPKEVVVTDEPFQELYHARPERFVLEDSNYPLFTFPQKQELVRAIGELPPKSRFEVAKTSRFVEREKSIFSGKAISEDFRENLIHGTDKSLDIYSGGGDQKSAVKPITQFSKSGAQSLTINQEKFVPLDFTLDLGYEGGVSFGVGKSPGFRFEGSKLPRTALSSREKSRSEPALSGRIFPVLRSNLRSRPVTRTGLRPVSKIMPDVRPVSRSVLRPSVESLVQPALSVRFRPALDMKLRAVPKTVPFVGTIPKVPPFIPRRDFKFGPNLRGKTRKFSSPFRVKYTPSLTARFAKPLRKAPKFVAGFEVRPFVIVKRKRKRR